MITVQEGDYVHLERLRLGRQELVEGYVLAVRGAHFLYAETVDGRPDRGRRSVGHVSEVITRW